MSQQVCHRMVRIRCRLWNVDLVGFLTRRLMFIFHLVFFLVVLSRDFFFLSFYIYCFSHVGDFVVYDVLFQTSSFL